MMLLHFSPLFLSLTFILFCFVAVGTDIPVRSLSVAHLAAVGGRERATPCGDAGAGDTNAAAVVNANFCEFIKGTPGVAFIMTAVAAASSLLVVLRGVHACFSFGEILYFRLY